MKNNPQQNFGFERARQNEVEGVLMSYLLTTQQAVASTARVLWPTVEAENRRAAEAQAIADAQAAVNPEVTKPSISAATVVARAMQEEQTVAPEENLLLESTDSDVLAAQQRRAIDEIHAEVAAERADITAGRINRGDYGRAA